MKSKQAYFANQLKVLSRFKSIFLIPSVMTSNHHNWQDDLEKYLDYGFDLNELNTLSYCWS